MFHLDGTAILTSGLGNTLQFVYFIEDWTPETMHSLIGKAVTCKGKVVGFVMDATLEKGRDLNVKIRLNKPEDY